MLESLDSTLQIFDIFIKIIAAKSVHLESDERLEFC